MECVIPSADWKLKSRKKKLSQYVTTTLEAFAVVVYYNSFEVWNQRWRAEVAAASSISGSEEIDDVSTLSGETKCTFRFTGDSKGSRKYEGWNSAGVEFYNDLLSLVERQRARPGCTFERDLLTALATKPKRGRANSSESQPPKARNHVSELMQIVGV
jgi:hypothetical protein